MRVLLVAVLSVAPCSLLLPAHLQAQQPAPFVAAASRTVDEADELERRAWALHSRPDQFAAAARLHVRAARLRSAGDRSAVESLTLASRLFWYAGQRDQALGAAAEAAERALAMGDVVTAAHRFVDAAIVAADLRDLRTARSAAERARLLIASPHISDEERAGIQARIRE